MAYGRKDYLGSKATTTLNGSINDSTTSITITSATGWPSVSNTGFYAVIDPDSATEEKVFVTARTGTGLTATRGVDGTTGVSHSSGATIRPCLTAVDFDEANYMVAETVGNATTAGDLLVASAANNLTPLAKGSNSTILAVDSGGTLGYTTAATAMFADSAVTNAKLAGMTRGTVKVGNSSGVASDLALGTSGYYLKSNGTDAVWASASGFWTTASFAYDVLRTSGDLANDDTLKFTAANGTVYQIEIVIRLDDNNGDNTTIAVGESGTTAGALAYVGTSQFLGTNVAVHGIIRTNRSDTYTLQQSAGNGTVYFRGWHVGAGGTFAVYWPTAAPGTVTFRAGRLRYRAIT